MRIKVVAMGLTSGLLAAVFLWQHGAVPRPPTAGADEVPVVRSGEAVPVLPPLSECCHRVPSPDTAAPLPRPQTITITRLGIQLQLQEGGDPDVVPNGVALHWPGTPWPCSPGHTYLYGHARTGVFLALWQSLVGDLVEFGDCTYIVDSIIRVPAEQVGTLVLTEEPGYTLTLQTSTGRNRDFPELLVHATSVRPTIHGAALEFDQDPELLTRVAFCESSFRPYVIGDGGLAVGLFQFHPDTWREESRFLGYTTDLRTDALASSRVASYMFSKGLQSRWSCYGIVAKGN